MSARLISVIGPPAVGKTTLAEALARELPAKLIYEDYAANPFLAESYNGDPSSRLPAQLYFLLSRVHQLSRRHWPEEGLVVCDYGFCQDRIFATQRLPAEDLPAYERAFQRVAGLVQPADVIIHLDACEPTLLERIVRRGRAFERSIDAGFLSAMRRSYNDAAASSACPVIAVNCDDCDLRQAEARRAVLGRIQAFLA